jgi:hypothetical protein
METPSFNESFLTPPSVLDATAGPGAIKTKGESALLKGSEVDGVTAEWIVGSWSLRCIGENRNAGSWALAVGVKGGETSWLFVRRRAGGRSALSRLGAAAANVSRESALRKEALDDDFELEEVCDSERVRVWTWVDFFRSFFELWSGGSGWKRKNDPLAAPPARNGSAVVGVVGEFELGPAVGKTFELVLLAFALLEGGTKD